MTGEGFSHRTVGAHLALDHHSAWDCAALRWTPDVEAGGEVFLTRDELLDLSRAAIEAARRIWVFAT